MVTHRRTTPSRAAALGTLVHRAALLPFLQRQLILSGLGAHERDFLFTLGRDQRAVSGYRRLKESSAILVHALEDAHARLEAGEVYLRTWPIVAALSHGGAFWDTDALSFCRLSAESRAWCIDRVEDACARVGEWMGEEAYKSRWDWMQSERDLWKDHDYSTESRRIDIMAGTSRHWRRAGLAGTVQPIDLWDLKVSTLPWKNREFNPLDHEHMRTTIETYKIWSKSAESPLRTAPVRIGLVFVHPNGDRACKTDMRWPNDWKQ